MSILLSIITACVAHDHHKIDNIAVSKANIELGVEYMQRGELILAEEKLLKALDFAPNLPEAKAAFEDYKARTQLHS